jgi:integrase/recombinase XerC
MDRGASEEERVRDVWNGFAAWMRDDQSYSIETRRGYVRVCQAAHRWLRSNGHQGLPWGTEETIRAFWDSVSPGPANRSKVRCALVAFYRFENKAGWRPDNPANALPRTKQPKRLPRPVAAPETKKLLDVAEAMGPMMAAIVHVFVFCGLRNAELRNLQWADLEGPWIRVIGKGNKERVVPVPPPAMLALVRWRNSSQSSGFMFHSARSEERPISHSTLANLMDELADIACVRVTPHMLRHTYGTEAYAVSDGDILAVGMAMGHSRPETTAMYAKVRPGRMAEIADKLTFEGRDPE